MIERTLGWELCSWVARIVCELISQLWGNSPLPVCGNFTVTESIPLRTIRQLLLGIFRSTDATDRTVGCTKIPASQPILQPGEVTGGLTVLSINNSCFAFPDIVQAYHPSTHSPHLPPGLLPFLFSVSPSHHTPALPTCHQLARPQPHPLLLTSDHKIPPETLHHPLVPDFAVVGLAVDGHVEFAVVGDVERCL